MAVQGMVQKSVADARFVYVARLWIRYFEMMVTAVTIRLAFEFPVQGNNVPHQIRLKYLHVISVSFSPQKLLPRLE